MINSDLDAARELEEGLIKHQNIPGADPESTFDNEKRHNVDVRNAFLDKLQREHEAARNKERELEREQTELGRKLNNLTDAQKKDRSASHPGEVDIARSSAGEYLRALGSATKTSSNHE
jgi:hypothetical protein